MEILIYFVTFSLTLLLGYLLGRNNSDDIVAMTKKLRRIVKPSKGMIIDYVTPDQSEYEGSEQQKIDQQQENLIKEAGIV